MRQNSERIYWMSNSEWYSIDKKSNCFVLTDVAPERAKRSFSMWSKPKKITLKRIIRICRSYLD